MIITRTPLRISLVGGGTDLAAFYTKHGNGAVVSMAIDKHIYVSINPKFDGRTRVSYSVTENVSDPMQLKHDIVRECLNVMKVSGVEITITADVPGTGTGLGSSSALACGILLGLLEYTKHSHGPKYLAELAYLVESGCGHPVGKQDHYAPAFGGLHFYEFRADGSTGVTCFDLLDEEYALIWDQLLLLWSGRPHPGGDVILRDQSNGFEHTGEIGKQMRDLAYALRGDLCGRIFRTIGPMLDENWNLKKQLAHGISDPWIDGIYRKAITAGAQGGKICGAGGGGFFLFCAPKDKHQAIIDTTGLRAIPFRIDSQGSTVIYNGRLR